MTRSAATAGEASRGASYRQGFRRHLYSRLIWPLLALGITGTIGALLVRPDLKGVWVIVTLLTAIGAFLPLQYAIALGALAFATAVPLLLTQQSLSMLSGEVFLVFALLPFAPVWLSAARAQQLAATRLNMMLSIPRVRAVLDVSDWSLLPRPRVIDRRLREMARAGAAPTPALLFRLDFLDMRRVSELLGRAPVQQAIFDFAGELHSLLRAGDMLTEDIEGQGAMYLLAFHNPDVPDSARALVRRLEPVLARSEFAVRLRYARVLEDGTRLWAMQWHDVDGSW